MDFPKQIVNLVFSYLSSVKPVLKNVTAPSAHERAVPASALNRKYAVVVSPNKAPQKDQSGGIGIDEYPADFLSIVDVFLHGNLFGRDAARDEARA